jgi:Zn-dependent M28 family amino/carboxypeptidase
VGLWTGEEQGLLGSRGYVAKNLATVGDGSDAAFFRALSGQPATVNKKPAHDRFAAYYNLDNGTGQIRGIYLQGNEALRPIFKQWFEPFKEWGVSTVTINNTSGTDHLSFDGVGLPGFQFIQDPVEYFTRTWHTTQDVSDRIVEEDLKRSAVIMAAFAYNTAMMDQRLPRKDSVAAMSASVFPGFDFGRELEEIAFRSSGLGFAVCGHEVDGRDLAGDFPAVLAVSAVSHSHAD